MPQQINLYHPILLTPRRVFSALALAQALGLVLVTLAALSWWVHDRTQTLQREAATAEPRQQAERARLQAELAKLPTGGAKDLQALEQELAAARRALAETEAKRDELRAAAAASPSTLLAGLAQALPAPVWLTEVRQQRGRLELAGATTQPEALQPWIAQWQPPGLPGARTPALVRVERPADASGPWTWRVVHGSAAQGAAR